MKTLLYLINKKQRGFSLVELMVVVAIMGTLAAIAIPAYNEYRKSAKKAAYKSDLQALHKGWLAFGVELDSFCERETEPKEAGIGNVGMISLLTSKLYGDGPKKWNFIGFSSQAHASFPCTPAATAIAKVVNPASISIIEKQADGIGSDGAAAAKEDGSCRVGVTEYKMGVYGHISGKNFIGYQITNNGIINEGLEQTHTNSNQQASLETACT